MKIIFKQYFNENEFIFITIFITTRFSTFIIAKFIESLYI